MLAITWNEYLTTVGITVGVYYAAVLLYSNRTKIKQYMKDQMGPNIKISAIDDEEEAEVVGIEGYDELERIVDGLKDSITGIAGENGTSKQALLEQLRLKLSGYDGLRRPAFQEAVTNFIIEHAKDICGVAFSAEELKEEWKSLPR